MAKRTYLALGALVMLATGAVAQELPQWRLNEICAGDGVPGQCAAFEGKARRALEGSWVFIPAAVRQGCLAAVKSPLDQSYRLLAGCVEDAYVRADDKRAVQTNRTPAEPVPLPKPKAEPQPAAVVPPPPAQPVAPALQPAPPPPVAAPKADAPPPPVQAPQPAAQPVAPAPQPAADPPAKKE